MNIFGQLKDAQLEITESDPTKKGQITFKDSTSKMLVNDGSSVKSMATSNEIPGDITDLGVSIGTDGQFVRSNGDGTFRTDTVSFPVAGEHKKDTVNITGNTTLTNGPQFVLAGSGYEITLPDALTNDGEEIIVRGGIGGCSVLVSGIPTPLVNLFESGDIVHLIASGTSWYVSSDQRAKHRISYSKNNTFTDSITSSFSPISLNEGVALGIEADVVLGRAIIKKASTYNFTGQALLTSTTWSTGAFDLAIYVNGSEVQRGFYNQQFATGARQASSTITAFNLVLSVDDTIEMRGRQTQTASINIHTGTSKESYTRWELVEV